MATEAQAINVIRGLAMDAPLAAKSGHQGTAMALAPLAHALFVNVMNYDSQAPDWRNRDRFILSCGHASILQYSMLYLTGYGLSLDDLKSFRQLGSATPGHPEAGHTAGVEVTTGPLGQGFANAVGMAISERYQRSLYGQDVIDHNIFVIASDGDLSEGISHEAASLAGHLQLGKLVCIYDDNKITIDGGTDLSYSEDAAQRFESYGWEVIKLGKASEDVAKLTEALQAARATSKPTMLIMESEVGFPSPNLTGNPKAHGLAFDADEVAATKEVMGLANEPFYVPDDVLSMYRAAGSRGSEVRQAWEASVDQSTFAHAAQVADAAKELAIEFDAAKPLATRKASQACLTELAGTVPTVIGGAADLTGNTGLKISDIAQSEADGAGRQIYFGIREHAQGAALVGAAQHGGVLPVSGTFLVFADYMRPSIRLAAMSGSQCVFVFTHDSVGVGEDGPTHQPIEQVMSLRSIPGLQVIRPADANETVSAWRQALSYAGPTALILSRQDLPILPGTHQDDMAGAYAVNDVESPDVILLATGSEVSLCAEAADKLRAQGKSARVVSMPNWLLFDQQSEEYQSRLLGGAPVLSVEAGVTLGWDKYADACVGIDRFGASGPAAEVMVELGLSVDNIATKAGELIK